MIFSLPEADFLEQLGAYKGPVAIDTETISLKDTSIIGIGAELGGYAFYLSVDLEFPEYSEGLGVLWDAVIANPERVKIYHNAVFDLDGLRELALAGDLALPDTENIEDSSLMAKAMGLPAALDKLSHYYFNDGNPYTIKGLLEETGRRSATMLDVEQNKVATKCMYDVLWTKRVYEKLKEDIRETKQEAPYALDMRVIPAMKRMQWRGLKIDHDVLERKEADLTLEIENIKSLCEGSFGFTPSKNAEVGAYLASRGYSLPYTDSGKQFKVDEDALVELRDPVADLVLRYRGAVKLNSTYIQPYKEVDRAYTHFRMDLATGRFASFDRNWQNIPPDTRDIFSADAGVFSWMDLSQVEMRVFAFLSGDSTMLKAYAMGEDIHALTQLSMWPGSDIKDDNYRKPAKTYNFAMIYDAGVGTLAQRTGLPKDQCAKFRQAWLRLYPGGANYMRAMRAKHDPYAETYFHRRMALPFDDPRGEYHVDTCRINYPVQGTAADLIKKILVEVDKQGADLRVQVHDELVVDGEFEFSKELEEIGGTLKVPFSSYRGEKWK